MEPITVILLPIIYITNKYSNKVTFLRKYFGMYSLSSTMTVKKALQIEKQTTTNCKHQSTFPCKLSYTYKVNELFLFNSGLPQQCPHGTSSFELPVLVGNDELTPIQETKSYYNANTPNSNFIIWLHLKLL
jgi:hypothetical protein